jgi:cyclic beta-1,2-glucan synthetase
LTALARDVVYGSALVALKTVLIAHQAWLMGDAIIRTLYRLIVSRKNCSNGAQLRKRRKPVGTIWHPITPPCAVRLSSPLSVLPFRCWRSRPARWVALIFALFWVGSPAFAYLVSRSAETEDHLQISDDDRKKLRMIARRTWHYFETFVTPDQSFLPPDNFQEVPRPVVANRTSPTNIGVYFLSIVSARDFGWISMADTVERLEATLDH